MVILMEDKLQIILDKLNDIEYGFVDKSKNIYPDTLKDWSNDFGILYYLQSPEELIKNKYGVCWDQVELERFYLTQNNIKSKSYFIIAYDNEQTHTHTFIAVKADKHYWLEHSWYPYRGIHKYKTLKELINDIKNKFKKSITKQNTSNCELAVYEYDKPIYNINSTEFINHCEKGKRIM